MHFLKHGKEQPAFMSGSPFPAELGLWSWVQRILWPYPCSRSQPSVVLLLPLAPGSWLCGSSYIYKYVLPLYPLGFHPCFLLLKWPADNYDASSGGGGMRNTVIYFLLPSVLFSILFSLCFPTQWMCFLPLSPFLDILVFIKLYSCHEMNLV